MDMCFPTWRQTPPTVRPCESVIVIRPTRLSPSGLTFSVTESVWFRVLVGDSGIVIVTDHTPSSGVAASAGEPHNDSASAPSRSTTEVLILNKDAARIKF